MSKKKNLKLTPDDELYVSEKMNGNYEEKYTTTIPCSNALNYKVDLKCKNEKQKEYCNLIKDKEITICSGVFGTGKSYCSNAAALQMLKDNNSPYRSILIVVPTCEAGNMSLGYLKGDLETKISVYLDADLYTMEKILNNSSNRTSGKEIVKNLKNCGMIEAEPVNFARGKTWDKKIILINEAENFSKQEMLLLLSRLGEKSKMIISGDPLQVDRKDIKNKEKCGLEYAMEKLVDMDEIGLIKFGEEDIVRNPLIGKILDKWK
jgi:phosphate starvation-inducible PhoH-like protein